jgi:YD repeat-containing protein
MGRALEDLRAERDAARERAPRYDAKPWNAEQQATHDAWVDAEIRATKRHLRELRGEGEEVVKYPPQGRMIPDGVGGKREQWLVYDQEGRWVAQRDTENEAWQAAEEIAARR